MSGLFAEYPVLEDDAVCLHRMHETDAKALREMTADRDVYAYLPAFLYEKRYGDPAAVLKHMDEECFLTKQSLFLGIYLKQEDMAFAGIAEIYAYEPERRKASVGYRLRKKYWGRGIASRTVRLRKAYLLEDAGICIITAHVRKENIVSGRVLQKNGFVCEYRDVPEDWGFEEPVAADQYVLRVYEDPGL